MSGANYGGRQANQSAYIKTFVEGTLEQLWVIDNVLNDVIVPVPPYKDIYIPGNIYLGGDVINLPTLTKVDMLHLMIRIQELEDKVRRLESRT